MPSEIDLFRDFILQQTHESIRPMDRAKLGEPATEEAIAAFETRYNVSLPADVREYFLKINGAEVADGFIGLEPLKNWCQIAECDDITGLPLRLHHVAGVLDEPETYFRFGYYDVSVWDWLIKLNKNADSLTPVVVVFQYVRATQLTDNLSDFLQKFRTGYPEALLGYD